MVSAAAALTTMLTPSAMAATCPCSIWSSTSTPALASDSDTRAVELGVKFRSDVAGYIHGIRFYKGAQNTGTHVGTLWSAAGTKLASATFTSETASGWQQVKFAQPVAITANTVYVASYHTNVGHYANDDRFFQSVGVDNPPLHALRNGISGANGVFRYGANSLFPSTGSLQTNYWVDVVFAETAGDVTPPIVTTRSPAANASGVATTTDVQATFSEDVVRPTIQFALTDAGGTAVTATTSYDSLTRTAKLVPTQPLANGKTYTATVSGAQDAAGNTLAPTSWSFTTKAPPAACPCTIWPNSTAPGTPSTADNSAIEVGVKFRSDTDGYITALRFYKGASNTGAHVGHLWTSGGTMLSEATFVNETPSGWQQVDLPAPVAVTAGTTYVASYHTDSGFYSSDNDYFATTGANSDPLHGLQEGVDGSNGVYQYGASAFPNLSFRSTNYWVDVVYNQTATDTSPPVVTSKSPAAGSTTAPATTNVVAAFNEPIQAASVSIALTGPGGPVAGTTSYDAASRSARFQPAGPLAFSAQYSVTVSGAKDTAGNLMQSETWSFATAAAPPPPPEEGPGGPILLVNSSADPFTKYYSEILRNEGLNEFSTVDVTALTASSLTGRDVVIVAGVGLSPGQQAALSDFVNSGGNVIAMRPDAQLAGLLGLTPAAGSISDGYLGVNTANETAAGITSQTMQFHGTADRYTLNGASTVATLYSNATTATTNPAVTVNGVGANGGRAAAFTYDLARSVVLSRQGNPTWAGQERDGNSPIRSDDQFFGGPLPDWVDLAKVAVPQADEQQRLLANLIETMNRHTKPLPRLWYFPKGLKAVVVGTGDDHGNGGTAGRFDQYVANSPAGCSVADWTCLRFSSYIYTGTPLSNAQATSYDQQGFEVGLHVSTGCADYTAAGIENDFATQLPEWQNKYTGLPAPQTNRTHCIPWSDWVGEPLTEAAHGIRLDTNYYYWPGSWITDRPGLFTGSGMPMRFANTDGKMIDVYQATTQMTDESNQSYPATPAALLDGALGANGYYGAFTANMHTDRATEFEDDQLIATAQARQVPIVSGQQMLTWLDGRNGSSFKNLAWANNALSFSVDIGAGARNLTVTLPTASAAGLLSSITLDGNPVSYRTDKIKGLEYAIFTAAAGTYKATYGSATTATVTAAAASPTTAATKSSAPTLQARAADSDAGAAEGAWSVARIGAADANGRESTIAGASVVSDPHSPASPPDVPPALALPRGLRAVALPDGTVTVKWRADAVADASVEFGTSSASLSDARDDYGEAAEHQVVLGELTPNTTYYFRVAVRTGQGEARTPTGSFTTPGYGVADSRQAQWRTGKASGLSTSDSGGGQLQLSSGSTAGDYMSRVLDAQQMVGWRRASWSADVPNGTSLTVSVRTGSTSTPDATWTDWVPVRSDGASLAGMVRDSRYLQYRVALAGTADATPVLHDIGFTSTGEPLKFETETGNGP